MEEVVVAEGRGEMDEFFFTYLFLKFAGAKTTFLWFFFRFFSSFLFSTF